MLNPDCDSRDNDREHKTNLRTCNMDEFTEGAFANRVEPIPVLALDPAEDGPEADDRKHPERKRDRLLKGASHIMKEGASQMMKEGASHIMKEGVRKAQGKLSESTASVQDRLLEKYTQPSSPVPRLIILIYPGSSNK